MLKYLGEEYWELTWMASGTLLDQGTMLEGIKTGTADMGYIDIANFPEDFPVSNLWVQPGIGGISASGGTAAFTDWVLKNQDKYEEFDDIVFLWGQSNGACSFLTADPVTGIASLKGKNIGTAPIMSKTLQQLGANPINVPNSEVYEALRNGMLDGMYQSIGGMVKFGYTDSVVNAFAVPMNAQVYCVAMNRSTFESMPLSQRQAFMDAWNEIFWDKLLPNWFENMILEIPRDYSESAVKVKWTVVEPGSDLEKEFVGAVSPLLDEYTAKLDGLGYDSTAIVKEIQDEMKYWSDNFYSTQDEIDPFLMAVDGTFEDWYKTYEPKPIPEHKIQTVE
jgi:TRAP-type C4-dicarboxylate transport system substrate-binding protein